MSRLVLLVLIVWWLTADDPTPTGAARTIQGFGGRVFGGAGSSGFGTPPACSGRGVPGCEGSDGEPPQFPINASMRSTANALGGSPGFPQ